MLVSFAGANSYDFTTNNLVLIHASEEFYPLRLTLLNTIKSKLTDYTNHVEHNVERDFVFDELLDKCQEVSLFGDKNLIILNFKTKPILEQQKQLAKLIAILGNENYLIINTDKLDKKDQSSAWFKNFAENGCTIAIAGNLNDLSTWSKQLFAETSININEDALNRLLELNSGNISELYQSIQRLGLFFEAGHNISLQDIVENLIDSAQYSVFGLSKYYLIGDLKKSLEILENILVAPEDAILINWMFIEDTRKLIKIKSGLRTSNFFMLCKELRIFGDATNGMQKAVERLSYAALVDVFDMLSQIDMAIKGALDKDVADLLKQVILKICKGS